MALLEFIYTFIIYVSLNFIINNQGDANRDDIIDRDDSHNLRQAEKTRRKSKRTYNKYDKKQNSDIKCKQYRRYTHGNRVEKSGKVEYNGRKYVVPTNNTCIPKQYISTKRKTDKRKTDKSKKCDERKKCDKRKKCDERKKCDKRKKCDERKKCDKSKSKKSKKSKKQNLDLSDVFSNKSYHKKSTYVSYYDYKNGKSDKRPKDNGKDKKKYCKENKKTKRHKKYYDNHCEKYYYRKCEKKKDKCKKCLDYKSEYISKYKKNYHAVPVHCKPSNKAVSNTTGIGINADNNNKIVVTNCNNKYTINNYHYGSSSKCKLSHNNDDNVNGDDNACAKTDNSSCDKKSDDSIPISTMEIESLIMDKTNQIGDIILEKVQKLIDEKCKILTAGQEIGGSDGCFNNLIISNTEKRTIIRFKKACHINVTMVGGGGAGGIGCISKHCFIYGAGGGAGGHDIKMIEVEKGEKWIIAIGKGGSSIESKNGGITYIKSIISHCDGKETVKFEIKIHGGHNGSPNMDQALAIIDQNGDDLSCCEELDLQKLIMGGGSGNKCNPNCGNGEDGGVGVPSQNAYTGAGGSTNFTGVGGAGGITNNIVGGSGVHGSGGGGSLPHIMDMNPIQTSGDGGDGYCILTVINSSHCCMEDLVDYLSCDS